jgi:hypothetical protein
MFKKKFFFIEKVDNLDIQKHAIIQAGLLMEKLTARRDKEEMGRKEKEGGMRKEDNNLFLQIKQKCISIAKSLLMHIEKVFDVPGSSLISSALDCLCSIVRFLKGDIDFSHHMLNALFKIPFGQKLCNTLTEICRCQRENHKREYLRSFQTRLLITTYEMLVSPSSYGGGPLENPGLSISHHERKIMSTPLYSRINIPPIVSFPVSLGFPPKVLHNSSPDSDIPYVPPTLYQRERVAKLTAHQEIQLPDNTNSDTEICIACVINYKCSVDKRFDKKGLYYPRIQELKYPSAVPSLPDVRCHLLHHREVFCAFLIKTIFGYSSCIFLSPSLRNLISLRFLLMLLLLQVQSSLTPVVLPNFEFWFIINNTFFFSCFMN